MARYLKEEDRRYAAENRLVERILRLALPLAAALGEEGALVDAYLAVLCRRSRLLSVPAAFRAGKAAGRAGLPPGVGFFRLLSRDCGGGKAEKNERALWILYRRMEARLGETAALDELTEVCRDLHSRSTELMFEVFAAGYLAGSRERNEKSPV